MAFHLPAHWYEDTVRNLVRNVLPPKLGTLADDNAWRYVYAVVMFATTHSGAEYMHFQESDKLKTQAGRDLSTRGKDYLDRHLLEGATCNSLNEVDEITKSYDAERIRQGYSATTKRDPNVTGVAFEVVLQQLIEDLCGVRPMRQPDLNKMKGFELAPVGYHSKPDLALFEPTDFRLVVSTKWTLRKERIGTFLHEAHYYKQRRPDLQVAFVVSEYQTNILKWLSQDPLADRVYHVNLDLLRHMIDPFKGVAVGTTFLPSQIMAMGRLRTNIETLMRMEDRVFSLPRLFQDIREMR